MPERLDEIHDAIKRNLKGKINPRTGKPYTEEEIWAIAQAQYQKEKGRKSEEMFFFKAQINKIWEEEITILKSNGLTEKSPHTFIEATVSGLKEDRDGEMMSKEAIEDMILQFKSGKIGFFPDHGFHEQSGQRNVYSWKQMMGVFVDARLDGDNLKAVARLNKAHPDYELFKAYIEEGMPLGFSIGGKPIESPKYVEIDDEEIELSEDIEIEKRKVTGMEEERKKRGMSVEEFYACPRDPPSESALPIFDEAHVRNAMARFNQTHFRNAEEKEKARRKIIARAKKYGIDTSGFEEATK